MSLAALARSCYFGLRITQTRVARLSSPTIPFDARTR